MSTARGSNSRRAQSCLPKRPRLRRGVIEHFHLLVDYSLTFITFTRHRLRSALPQPSLNKTWALSINLVDNRMVNSSEATSGVRGATVI